MEPVLEVTVVSTHPGGSRTPKHLLEAGSRPVRCRVLAHPAAAGNPAGPQPDVLIPAPQTWEEMSRWVRPLQARFAAVPWLLFADHRIAGMFLSFLPPSPRCALLAPLAPPDELREALAALLSGAPLCTPDDLLARVNQALAAPDGSPGPALQPRELQLGCACTFGLTNREIAHTLGGTEGVVKNQFYALYRKLHVESRRELAAAITRALFPETSPN